MCTESIEIIFMKIFSKKKGKKKEMAIIFTLPYRRVQFFFKKNIINEKAGTLMYNK